MDNKIISPIAIDMGAKNTGVYLNHFEQGEDPTTSGNTQGKTIVIDSNAITWSQAGRTQKRHQIRGNKRRKLAKRLLRLILTDAYKLTPTQEQLEYLMGLLNNRGYTYLVEGLDEALIKQNFVAEYFVNKHNGFFKDVNTFYSDFLALSNNLEESKRLSKKLVLSKNEAKKELEDNTQEFANAYDNIKKVLSTQIKSEQDGHKYRSQYLSNIKKDIENRELLKPLFNGDLTTEKLSCLIGNISNLQLRILRKYFNNEAMKNGDQWLPERLHKFFFRWVRSWHAKLENEKESRWALLKLKDKDILEVFATEDPIQTIPPYEDQNNRIKESVKDKTLRLNPDALDKELTGWQEITNEIVKSYCFPTNDSSITTRCSDIDNNIQESTHPNIHKIKDEQEKDKDFKRRKLANVLQRIFDRSRKLDPYRLRLLCAVDSLSNVKEEARISINLLESHIGKNNIESFVALCETYYDEVQIAKQGLWSPNANSLFFVCNTNPPHKSNLQHKLVGHIVRKPLTEKQLEQFKQECWGSRIGRSTLKGMAKKVEETRKDYGNAFNDTMQKLQKREYMLKTRPEKITEEQKKRWNTEIKKEHKSVVEAVNNARIIAKHIAEYFQDDNQEKYSNPFSIAQLYNHLETNIGGFNKTDKWNTEENAWRDEMQLVEATNRKTGEVVEGEAANATRIAKDSVRPFDGMLARILGRQAYEIAQFKIKQIEQLSLDKKDKLIIPILLEQNKFKFEESLHEIKGVKNVKKKARDRAEKGLKKQNKQWQEKNERIAGVSKYCPYTDNVMAGGEIDHIIPRSQSKNRGDVVFNSEANLIYCSGVGNHAKGDRRYTFDNLQLKYLKSIFGQKDKNSIKQEISNFINDFDEAGFASFHTLDTREQQYLRHALFMPELDNKTFPLLNTRYKTIVNGTQSYLAKLLVKTLRNNYPDALFKIYKIDAYEVSQLRDTLGREYTKFAKSERQGSFSHVIDAALVFATALQVEQTAETLQTVNTSVLSENAEWLKDLLPSTSSIKQVERKPKYRKDLSSTQIFKEGLYGERFMSILLDDNKLYYGFALDNCHEVEPLKLPKKGIKDFDKKLEKARDKQLIAQNKYFDLLKPFLYTGSTRKKNKNPVMNNLAENQQKYSYLSIDKAKALAHLQKCAKEVCSDESIKQAVALEKLRYCVEKKKIRSVLLEGQSKVKFIAQLDERKFTVSQLKLPFKNEWLRLLEHPISDYQKNKTTLRECFGKDEQIEINNHEMTNFWQNLAVKSGLDEGVLKKELLKINTETNDLFKPDTIIPKTVFNMKIKTNESLEALKENKLLNKSFGMSFMKKEDLIPQESWNKLFDEFFNINKVKNDYCHKRVRKDYSLPVVSSPSGGFRIKRKNPITDEIVYQVSSIADGGYACGFSKDENGNINMTADGVTFNSGLKSSRNVAYMGKSGKPNIKKEQDGNLIEPFGSTRKVKLDPKSILSGYLTLAEAGRIDIKIKVSIDTFKKIVEVLDGIDSNQPPANISMIFKKDNKGEVKKHEAFKKILDDKNIPMPRDSGNTNKWTYKFDVQISQDSVVLDYRTSLSKEMKIAYQNGTPIN